MVNVPCRLPTRCRRTTSIPCSLMPNRCPRNTDTKGQLFNNLPPTYSSIAETILDVRCGTNAWNLCIASGSQQFCCFVENVTNNNPHIHHLLKSKKARLSIERQTLDRCRAYVTVCRLHGYLHPAPLVPRWCPRGHRHRGSAIKLFLHPPRSLLILFYIIYNHASNGRGFFRPHPRETDSPGRS